MDFILKKDFLAIGIVSLVLGMLCYYFYESEITNLDLQIENEQVIQEPKPTIYKYEIPIDSFEIFNGIVKRNQNLSEILTKYDISAFIIDKIAKKSKGIFDLRKIKFNQKYTAFCKKDSSRQLHYFVYEHSPIDYVVFDLKDSIEVFMKKKEIITRRKTASGRIESSLWNAIKENNLNPVLAIELSEIYAWSIDFFGIQKGDAFKILYDEQFVDSQSVGISNIYTSVFRHMNTDFYAFQFEQDNTMSYFDENGNSLRKAFLKAPLRFSRISSKFSNSRFHPVLKIRRPHHGIDYAAPAGTPVLAIGDGVIIKKGYQKNGGGRYLKIKHNSIYTTVYMHFSRYSKGMNQGAYVKQGDVIGYVGSSGLATGPHLDFRFYKNGTAVDPLKIKAPPVEPVKKQNIEQFEELITLYQNEIFNIGLFYF
ncbi:MAG: peptidoglycan DD-metalloendopeptidase family protein [Bacteroidetes bacterium]|jgi:murein DD-endopeptidase MepM/ murein hydrolase activator NlpD|nr:peptidoglycan DD-metalloendopeptidase family protein [Bacteroidota bacterium]MBT6687389.1 peptidoglycan DD-metalloendopeptidase family protein [Bacteroidota bacterium]MBT7144860.1 peptidoglycan DD-metalloendopeptidase family protein [Bacteroidota bacterium]MBT7492020.1 peptidoglycan DD-metalloendopeptidase family protein [Bacteroidota bacterium]